MYFPEAARSFWELPWWTSTIWCVVSASPALYTHGYQVGPKIEYSRGDIFEDEEVAKILPFLALPDGAHLVCRVLSSVIRIAYVPQSAEDYSYFHLVPSGPKPTTVFGISCVATPRACPLRLILSVQMQPTNRCLRPSCQDARRSAVNGTEGGRRTCIKADLRSHTVCTATFVQRTRLSVRSATSSVS